VTYLWCHGTLNIVSRQGHLVAVILIICCCGLHRRRELRRKGAWCYSNTRNRDSPLGQFHSFCKCCIAPIVTRWFLLALCDVTSQWFVPITSVQWPSRRKFVYCLANKQLMAYHTSRYINAVVFTCQVLVQRKSFIFCHNAFVKQLGPSICCVFPGNYKVYSVSKAMTHFILFLCLT